MIKKRIYKERIDMLRESSRIERVDYLQKEYDYTIGYYNELLKKIGNLITL